MHLSVQFAWPYPNARLFLGSCVFKEPSKIVQCAVFCMCGCAASKHLCLIQESISAPKNHISTCLTISVFISQKLRGQRHMLKVRHIVKCFPNSGLNQTYHIG